MTFGCEPSAGAVLWYVVFFGFAINYMVRINVNIAIVSMVQPRGRPAGETDARVSECFPAGGDEPSPPRGGAAGGNASAPRVAEEEPAQFPWDEHQQSLVLGAFFWAHWATQLPGGVLAQRYGTKLVFGLSNWLQCLLSFFIPLAAQLDLRILVFIRFLQGLIAGFAWPSMHNLTAAWVPPNERSKFVTSYMGSSVGVMVTFPLFGWLTGVHGWPSVFYVTGALGTAWFCAWWLLVFDTPAEHPRMSSEERDRIEDSLRHSKASKKLPTPWKHILLSAPVWMNIVAQWGDTWEMFTLTTQAPTYFKYIHGWDVGMTGLLSGLPHLCRIVVAYFMGVLCDWLLQSDVLPRTAVRKIATAVCCIGQGVFTVGLAFSGCNKLVSVACLMLATGMSGAISSGPLASHIDLSPNFASILLGVGNMITVIPGIISPIIVGILTYHNQTVGQWQTVFLITAVMSASVGVCYLLCGSSELQEWNDPAPTQGLKLLSGAGQALLPEHGTPTARRGAEDA
ncbi:putative inorganic phosphate cotransporter isoform X2 [Bacillus rossius redtenbacheri]|uniref:putative inorganic phosphate cotransporter isoform X2 n=1 Tax=Bacillus rossius redtenbacheri TaxID=93214 RepID=UPI002FDD50AF